jgi:uncharacterized membrane protein
MSVGSNSNLGGVGALLVAVTSVFSLGLSVVNIFGHSAMSVGLSFLVLPLGLTGYILFYLGMNGLGNTYQHRAIFNNALYAVLAAIAGGVLVVFAAFIVVLSSATTIISTITATPITQEVTLQTLRSIAGSLIPVLVAGAVVPIVSALFMMRAFNALAAKSGAATFRTAGVLFLVSGVLSGMLIVLAGILVLYGMLAVKFFAVISFPASIVQLAAWTVAAQGFFSLKTSTKQPNPTFPTNTFTPPTYTVQYCIYCGTPNNTNDSYCKNCGRPLNKNT